MGQVLALKEDTSKNRCEDCHLQRTVILSENEGSNYSGIQDTSHSFRMTVKVA